MILFTDDTFIEIINYANKLGVLAILLIIIYGGIKKWWVFGWHYREQVERCDKIIEEKDAWRDTALNAHSIATEAFRRGR